MSINFTSLRYRPFRKYYRR